MSNDPEELDRDLELLRAQVASLAIRVNKLEALSGGSSAASSAPQPITGRIVAPAASPPIGSPATAQELPNPPRATSGSSVAGSGAVTQRFDLPQFAHVERAASDDLEQQIGQCWLNRIGIVAVL